MLEVYPFRIQSNSTHGQCSFRRVRVILTERRHSIELEQASLLQ